MPRIMRTDQKLIINMIGECKKHDHDIRSKHVAVIIKNGRPISEYKFNHLRENLMGLSSNTAHAEIAAIDELYRRCCMDAGLSRSNINMIGKYVQYLSRIYPQHIKYTGSIPEDKWHVLCR